MIGRIPHHRHFSDEIEPFALHVFIPGALASGFLVSVGLLVGDTVRRIRGDHGTLRRVTMTGAALAAEVRDGSGAAQKSAAGLRHRGTYGIVGTLALAVAVGVLPGATWNFLDPGGYISDIAWIWALSLLGMITAVVLAVQALRLAPEWVPASAALIGSGVILRFVFGPESGTVRVVVIAVAAIVTPAVVAATWHLRAQREIVRVPGSVRPLLYATPLGRECRSDEAAVISSPRPRQWLMPVPRLPRPSIAIGRTGVIGLVIALGVLSAGARFADDQVEWIDIRIGDLVDSQRHLDFFRQVSRLGSTEFTVTFAIVVAAAMWRRCRPIAILYPTAVTVGLFVNVVVKVVISRSRPPGSLTGTALDSFPSGHTIQAVVTLGLLPPVLYVLTESRGIAIATTILAAVGAAGVGVSRVVLAAHWPTDIVGGVIIGILVLLASEAAIDRMPVKWIPPSTDCPLHRAWGMAHDT